MAREIHFDLLRVDPTGARRARFRTVHGTVDTPTFMPVGTQGSVKGVLPRDLAEIGPDVVLANTYHLSLEGRTDLVEHAGGLHKVLGWDKTILTDSGGFQVFSLPGKQVTEDGVLFPASPGHPRMLLDPETSMDIQRRLGADIVMAFDECCPHDAPESYIAASVERTTRWAHRCRDQRLGPHQFLFGIVQGGVYRNQRVRSAEAITAIDFEGFAIGGVSVGEGHELMKAVTGWTAPLLPEHKPRYLMGVGLPEDILEAVERGMDMFDCVIPTRYARGGTLFTRKGRIRIGDRVHQRDRDPIDARCGCYTCRTFSRMVLRHLHYAHEPVFDTLASIHNLQFYTDLMAGCRHEIERGRFGAWKDAWLRRYLGSDAPGSGPFESTRLDEGADGATAKRGGGGRGAGGRAAEIRDDTISPGSKPSGGAKGRAGKAGGTRGTGSGPKTKGGKPGGPREGRPKRPGSGGTGGRGGSRRPGTR